MTSEDVDGILCTFEHAVNFWYPTASQDQLQNARTIISNGNFDDENGLDVCNALLTMALGCASKVTAGLMEGATLPEGEQRRRATYRAAGNMYFESAMKKLYVAHMDVSSIAAQCLFFVA